MDTGISSRVLNEIKDMAKKNQLDKVILIWQ